MKKQNIRITTDLAKLGGFDTKEEWEIGDR